MSQERDPHKAVDYIIANATKFAKAKSERVYLEEYRKSLRIPTGKYVLGRLVSFGKSAQGSGIKGWIKPLRC